MFAIVGILVVLGAVMGGYLMEHGHIRVLMQPAELLIIAGAATGTLLIANPLRILLRVTRSLGGIVAGSSFDQARYLDSLKMMFDLLTKGRKDGLVALETDIEEPDKSELFKKYPSFLKDHHARDFVCDTLRMAITGSLDPFDVDQMMEQDMEVHHQESSDSVAALTTMAESLPGLGIVAAVLGVVITMGSLGGPPEQIGEKVAAALVGTFLGVLLCYGFVGPLASNMAKLAEEERAYYHVLRIVLVAYIKGTPPVLAVETARRAVPTHVRPTFAQLEQACKNRGSASGEAPEAAPAGAAA
jgi:chemotaxis protein MotA